jgi:hypothetical protein
VSTVLVSAVPDPTHAVDISDHFDLGIESLQAHAEYLRGLGDGPMADPTEFLESFARQAGTRLGVRYGAGFEVLDV